MAFEPEEGSTAAGGGDDATEPSGRDERPEGPGPTAAGPAPDPLLRCLVHLSVFFERPVAETDIRAVAPIPADGMTPDTFRHAARRLGYVTKEVPIGRQGIRDLPVPFVVLGDVDHPPRVVLDRREERLDVYDPLADEVRPLSASDAAGRSDRALLIRPAREESPAGDWRRLVARRIRRVAVEMAVASAVINLFALATPLFAMTVYNKVVGQRAVDTLDVLVIGMLVVYGFDGIIRGIRGYVASHTGARLDALIGGEAVHRLLRQPYRFFEATPSGVIAERLRQLDVIRSFFTGQMPLVLVDLVFVAVFVAALFYIDARIAWITVAAIPVFIAISAAFHHAQRQLVERNFRALAAKASTLNESLANALTIKSLGLESEIERRWSERLASSARSGFRASNMAQLVNTFGTVTQQLVSLGIIFYGARLIIAGEMSIGALIAASILTARTLAPVRQVVTAWHQLQEVRAAFRRLGTIMDAPPEHRPGDRAPVPVLRGDIRFENVSFSFAEDRPPALRDIDLEVESGTVLAIIGPSGSGKSTLVKLLQGLYRPTAGRILIDRTDIGHIPPATLRRQIGTVPQEVQLFAGTVRENIAMGHSDKIPERIVAVAKFVGAHEFIQRLPQGYDTVLSERGGGLSAGQRQLLCIARALIRNPRILVLDEATSDLDPATEELFLRNLRRASEGRTVVLVTHRLAPLAIADKAALLIDGRLERVGPPAEVAAAAKLRLSEHSLLGRS